MQARLSAAMLSRGRIMRKLHRTFLPISVVSRVLTKRTSAAATWGRLRVRAISMKDAHARPTNYAITVTGAAGAIQLATQVTVTVE